MAIQTRFPPAEAGHFSSGDGVQLQYRIHRGQDPKFSVLVVHGFAEHGNRYGHVVDELVPAGAAVMTYDQRGHGTSGGKRVFVSRFGEYGDDLALALELAGRKLPQPLFVLGHSMGGLIVLLAARKKPAGVAGWIVSNPGLRNKVPVPAWKESLAKVASSLAPGLSIPSGIPPSHVSRDKDEVREYDGDMLNNKNATARWYTEFVAAQADLLAQPEALQGLPLLVQVGDGDLIVEPAATLDFVSKTGPSTELKVYPGLYHEIYNELAADRQRVLADLRGWLLARV